MKFVIKETVWGREEGRENGKRRKHERKGNNVRDLPTRGQKKKNKETEKIKEMVKFVIKEMIWRREE